MSLKTFAISIDQVSSNQINILVNGNTKEEKFT